MDNKNKNKKTAPPRRLTDAESLARRIADHNAITGASLKVPSQKNEDKEEDGWS